LFLFSIIELTIWNVSIGDEVIMHAELDNIHDLENAIQTAAESNQPIYITYQGLPKTVLLNNKDYETLLAQKPSEELLAELNNLEEAYLRIMLAMVSAMDAHESYLEGHSERVAILSCDTAGVLGLGADEINEIKLAALLHDIGEIIIPRQILQKTTPLTDDEIKLIREHPKTSADFVRSVKELSKIAETIHAHHERFDGCGYPRGLKGEEIPLGARIINVVDTYDAITNVRLHRDNRLHPQAVSELEKDKGKAFDPQVVDAFLSLF